MGLKLLSRESFPVSVRWVLPLTCPLRKLEAGPEPVHSDERSERHIFHKLIMLSHISSCHSDTEVAFFRLTNQLFESSLHLSITLLQDLEIWSEHIKIKVSK